MNKKRTSAEGPMDFEYMLRQFLGNKAFQTQGLRSNPKIIKRELRKILRKISKKIDNIDTTTRHKELLMHEIEKLQYDLEFKNIDLWTIIIHLFTLISRLLGYDYHGVHINTPVYFQSENQYYIQIVLDGGDVIQDYYDKKNIITIRKKLYKELKNKNYSDFKIAQILNMSEYQIKKLKE